MQVCIQGDNGISREKHAFISFDPKKGVFMLRPGESSELVYLKGDPVYLPTALTPYDIVELGSTRLMFIPFCGEKFQWT